MRGVGKMRYSITIQRATNSVDGNGTPVQTWADLVTLRAKLPDVDGSWESRTPITPAITREDTEHSGIAVTTTAVRFQTHFYDGITLNDRAVIDGVVYQIKFWRIIPPRRGLELHLLLLGNS